MTKSKTLSRSNVAHALSKYIAREGAASILPVQVADGSRPVVLALETDLVSQVLRRVAESHHANVVVGTTQGIAILSFVAADGDDPSRESQTVHDDVDMGMLIASIPTLSDASGSLTIRVHVGDQQADVPAASHRSLQPA